jgi:catechol 2,3-dioxygenase-like lactoylglutathione lyase family enzyme
MLNTAKPICFAATTNPNLAKKFYKDVLSLSLVEDNPFALVFDANGTMLRVQKVQEHSPARHTVLGWEVADIAATIRQMAKKGVRFERYDGLTQDPLGVWISPVGAKVAWFNDPDGNILSLTQFP